MFASSLVCVVHTNNENVPSIKTSCFRMLGNIICPNMQSLSGHSLFILTVTKEIEMRLESMFSNIEMGEDSDFEEDDEDNEEDGEE